jgi:malate/lactate dehydrogenase
LNDEFIKVVSKRGAAIIEARKLSSAMSAANAAVEHCYDWIHGTAQGEFVSMAVISNGEYGVEPGLCYSYPCRTNNFEWEVVTGLSIDSFS